MVKVHPEGARETAQGVIRTEAQALLRLAQDLPQDFNVVINLMADLKGRVIVSGMGKSGHIGRKIAATLASTGTPAQFVHPGEASHGDLGMITQNDVVFLVSNSGETAELKDILAYTRRFDVSLVAVSKVADSTLMKAADYRLLLPDHSEACGLGMVPTTSTTLTLALGDALAVALLKRRNFRAEDFAVLHPGGKLGAQMAQVHTLMHTGVSLPIVQVDTPMSDVLVEMSAKGFGVAIVLNHDALVGIVTDGDLRRNMEHLMARTAGEVASLNPISVTPDTLAASALALMQSRKITALMVCDEDNKPQGLLKLHDLIRASVA